MRKRKYIRWGPEKCILKSLSPELASKRRGGSNFFRIEVLDSSWVISLFGTNKCQITKVATVSLEIFYRMEPNQTVMAQTRPTFIPFNAAKKPKNLRNWYLHHFSSPNFLRSENVGRRIFSDFKFTIRWRLKISSRGYPIFVFTSKSGNHWYYTFVIMSFRINSDVFSLFACFGNIKNNYGWVYVCLCINVWEQQTSARFPLQQPGIFSFLLHYLLIVVVQK